MPTPHLHTSNDLPCTLCGVSFPHKHPDDTKPREFESWFTNSEWWEDEINQCVYSHIFGDARPSLNCQPHELSIELQKIAAEIARRTRAEVREEIENLRQSMPADEDANGNDLLLRVLDADSLKD